MAWNMSLTACVTLPPVVPGIHGPILPAARFGVEYRQLDGQWVFARELSSGQSNASGGRRAG